MSYMLPLRAYNRSRKPRIGGKTLQQGTYTLVNQDNPRVRRDLSRVSAVGSSYSAGVPFSQADSGTVEQGGRVTVEGHTASSTAVVVKSTAGVLSSGAADTEALTVPHATLPRIDLLSVTLAAPQTLVETNGTALAGATPENLGIQAAAQRPAVPASSVALAYVCWAAQTASVTVAAATNIWTLASHGFAAGQKLTVATITTITTPAVGTVLYVKPINANTFTLSTSVGGADFDVTAADGSATFNFDPVVVDARA